MEETRIILIRIAGLLDLPEEVTRENESTESIAQQIYNRIAETKGLIRQLSKQFGEI